MLHIVIMTLLLIIPVRLRTQIIESLGSSLGNGQMMPPHCHWIPRLPLNAPVIAPTASTSAVSTEEEDDRLARRV